MIAILPIEIPEEYYDQLRPVMDAYLLDNPGEDIHALFQRAIAYYLVAQDTPGSLSLLIQSYPLYGREAA